MQLSSQRLHLPIRPSSSLPLNRASRRYAQLRLPLLQREQKLAEEHLPQYHQGWSYLDDVGTGGGVDNRTLEMASGCPLWVGLVEEDCHRETRAKNLSLSHSYSVAPEEARQNRQGQRNLDLRLAGAGTGDLMAEGPVEEDLDLSASMDP